MEAIGARLVRLCELLGIAGAQLTGYGEDRSVLASTGEAPEILATLERQAFAGLDALVLADSGRDGAQFYVGLRFETAHGDALLSLFDPRPRSPLMAEQVLGLARDVTAQAIIAQQRRQIEGQADTIASHASMEQQRLGLFERASRTAKIGVWQYDLVKSTLTWTNGVYDLFEIPRGTPLTRDMTVQHYTDISRKEMEEARAKAIANCSDFSLDAEIVTAKGNRRWMRLTGAVESREGVAVAIFGMKQDITEEKLMANHNRYLAEFDVMTGLANRAKFQARLAEVDAAGGGIGAMLLVDLDGFKQINDTYGHARGDECIRQAAIRLRDCCVGADLVARIGGDEFAVLAGPKMDRLEVEDMASDIVAALRRPFVRAGETMAMGASVGIAMATGASTSDLFRQADTALYAAKAAGRGTSRTFGVPVRRTG